MVSIFINRMFKKILNKVYSWGKKLNNKVKYIYKVDKLKNSEKSNEKPS